MAGESYTTKKILLKAVDGTTTQYFIPYVNNATADKTGLVKPDGTTITVDANGTISAQVDTSGLQSKIDADHKLSADLISDGTTNKVVTATEKSTWNGKQDVISDLSTIRANATAGAEAASTIAGYGDIVTHNADEFLTEHQDISGKQDKITSTNKLSADLISEGTTNKLVSASEKSAWNNKQDTILDLDTIRSNATAGAGAATTIAGYGDVVTHDADEFAEATHTHTKSQITDFPTIPTVNDAEIEIQKNGTKVGSFTTNQGGSKQTINITVPTSAADVSALPASTKYGSTIDLTVDPDTYVVTATLKDQDGTALSLDTIDLPLESVVVSGSYDNTNKKVILTLQSGSTVEFSVADLVSGLQTEITSTNKLSADLIKDGTTNKTVTATEKSTWNSKQDAINDLSTIRSNAEAGANAATTISSYGDIVTHNADEFAEAEHTHAISDITNLQTTLNGKQATISDLSTIRANATAGANAASTIAGYGDIVTHDASEFLTEHQDISGKQDKITSTNKLDADLLVDGVTNKVVTATEKATWNAKQEAISDLSTIRSNATAGAEAASTISGYGDIVTHNADEFLTEHQDISGKQDKIDDLAAIRSGATAGATAVQPGDLATVATSGSYNDLADKPTIPSVGNAEIEIQKNGTKVDSFTTNQSGSKKTINITVPTNNNQLTNGAGYITSAALPTKLSDLTDDLGTNPVHTHGQYLTEHQDISGKANIADLATVATSGSYNDLVDKPTIPSAVTVDSALSSTSTNPVQNKVINTALSGKQDTISDLSTIRSNAEAGAGAATIIAGYGDIVTHNADEFLTEHQDISGKANIADLATVATSGSYADLLNKPTIPTVNDAEIEIQKNGTKVDSFTLNQTLNKIINIAVPTTAADVSALPDSTKYAASLSLSVDPDTYVITGQLKDQDGNNLGTAGTIDLPLESVVVSGSYNSSTKKVVLTLKDGSTVEFSIADLVSGLQTEITSTNKLSADLISDGTTNKTVTATEKATWNAKQAAIADLDTIRTNASNGASAYTTISGYGDIVTHNADEFANADHTHSQYLTSVAWGDVTGKPSTFTPASHNQASSTINALDGYNKSVSGGTGALGTSDTLNKALAKLENALDGKQASGSYATTSDISDMATKTWVGNQGYTNNVGTVTKVNNTSPDANGNVTLSIPSAVTESTVSGWGFTKNAGTVTKVNNVSPVNGNVTLSIPTVTDTYSATSSNAMSGKAVASAISGKADVSAIPTVPTTLSAFTDDLGSSPTHTHSQYLTSVTAHNQASNTINKMTSYAKASSSAAIATTDSLNTAVGKLEYKIDDVDIQLQALTAMLNAAS